MLQKCCKGLRCCPCYAPSWPQSHVKGCEVVFAKHHGGARCLAMFLSLYYYSSHRHVPLLLFRSVKLAFPVRLWGPIPSPLSHQKLATNPRSPPVGLSRGNLAVKFCSVVGARCLQCWRFFVRILWPRFGSILRTQIWTHVSISLLRLNIGVQKWTHFRAHFMDPNLVRQPRAENA